MLTMWATVPQRARMISSMVWAVGALRLISMARMPNSRICMVAPAAYLQCWRHVLRSCMLTLHDLVGHAPSKLCESASLQSAERTSFGSQGDALCLR